MSLPISALDADIVEQAKNLPAAPKKVPEGLEPTPEQWTRYQDIIKHLYLDRSLTLPETRAVLWHHGLCATERQYKARFHKWEFPDKKVDHDVYKAMECISDFCDTNMFEVRFIVPTGVQQRSITRPQIKKEVLRQNMKWPVGHPMRQRRLRTNEAFDILESKNCSILGDIGVLRRDNDLFRVPRPSEGASRSYTSLASTVNATSPKPTSSTAIPQVDPFLRTPTLLLQRGGVSPSAQDHEDYCFIASPSSDGMTEFDYMDMADSVDAMHLYVDTQEWIKVPEPRPLHFQGPLRSNKYPQKANACQWASSTFLECFGVDAHNSGSLHFDHSRAMNVLQRMLYEPTQNRCILPCLNWMSCVLSFNRKWTALEGFLESSVHVVEDTLGSELLFTTPFRFSLACCRDDANGIDWWGTRLPDSHKQVVSVFGEHHPNEVVHLYYWAWYALYQKNYQHAIELLHWCLPRALSVMGNDNLITIQCMVMLTRAYASTMQHQQAITILENTLRLLKPKRPLEAYRFEMLRLIAESCVQTGQLQRARALLEEVVAGLVERFGLLIYEDSRQSENEGQDQVVWRVIWLLRDVMERQGQTYEALRMFEGFTQQFYEELQLAEDSPATTLCYRTLQRSLPIRPLLHSEPGSFHGLPDLEA